jgi:hypothetical protein
VTSFTAPYVDSNTTLTFRLTVTDGSFKSATDTVDVSIADINDPPVADAGDGFSIKEGATAVLNGTGSYDPNNDAPLYYEWSQVSGPAVELVQATSATPMFSVPAGVGEILVFELVVSDRNEASSPARVQVKIVANARPTANAGSDQTKNEGSTVTLDGHGSFDADGDGLIFSWNQVSGPQVALSSQTSGTPTFTGPFVSSGGAQLLFQLVVTDTDPAHPLQSLPAYVTVTVANINDPPKCDLGRLSQSVLWPPNHTMIPVTVRAVSDPDSKSSDVVVRIATVTQDEPVNGPDSGDTSPDAIVDGGSALIRAERSGAGNGRVYRVVFTASDGLESCSGAQEVSVPLGRKDQAQDDGQLYDSTQP